MTEKENYRKKLAKFLIALRDVGMETKYHVYDILLDPHRTRKRKSQFIAVAIVSKEEVDGEDLSVLENFTDYVHGLQNPSALRSKIVHYERVAFAMNAGEKYFFEHGECRIFDPERKLLFKIIDGETASQHEEKEQRRCIQAADKWGVGVLENMENTYKNIYHNLDNAIVLLFSFYIPCSIDYHSCAKLLQEFVKASGHQLIVGYELIHNYTDYNLSLKWMKLQNITVLNGIELERELLCQFDRFIRHNDDSIWTLDYSSELDNADELFNTEDVYEFTKRKHSRSFGKVLCKRILKACNESH